MATQAKMFIRPLKRGRIGSALREVSWLLGQWEAQKTGGLVMVNLVITCVLLSWCHTTRSMALMAYTYLSWFSLLSLVTCLICIWVGSQNACLTFTYGYVRLEVLSVFVSVILCLLGSIIVIKETIERMLQPDEVHTGLLTIGGITGLALHLGMTSLVYNPPLSHVLQASQSSPLQVHVSDICESVCVYLPMLRAVLLPRVNPLILISLAGFFAIIADHIIIQIYNYQAADQLAALLIAGLTITTMFPLALCSGQILLQTTPYSVIGQLDTRLREALTLDGVLEFRNESFWTLGIGATAPKGKASSEAGIILAGSLHVRVRRDANEQIVLAHVKERLGSLVPLLTVQVFKDDWTRSATTLQLLKDSGRPMASPVTSSSSPHYVNISYPPQMALFSDQYSMSPYYTINPSSPWQPVGTGAPIGNSSYNNDMEINDNAIPGYINESVNDNLYNKGSNNNNGPAYNRQYNNQHFNNASLEGNINKTPINLNKEEPFYSNLSINSGNVNITSPNVSSQSWNDISDDSVSLDSQIRSTASPQLPGIQKPPSPYYVNLEFLQKNKANNESSHSHVESVDMPR